MVKIDALFRRGLVSRISETELERYANFFENSYRENLEHSEANMEKFPRWSIISGYYAMHDITKLLLAKRFRLKVELKVHATTIQVLRDLVKDREITGMMEKGYSEFMALANDLFQAKRERVKAQYHTGTKFMHAEYMKRANEFHSAVVLKYVAKIRGLLG